MLTQLYRLARRSCARVHDRSRARMAAAAGNSRAGSGPTNTSGAVSKTKRNDLSLKLKYEVIKTAEKAPKIRVRKLACLYSCGKTQISTILTNKEKIMEIYEGQNASAQKCHKRNRESKYSDLNEALHAWFCLAVSKNVYPDASILKEKALEIAGRLGCDEFKGSNGWLDRWNKRYNVRQMKLVVSREMCLVLQSIHGRRGFQILFRATVLKIYGTLMRLDAFGTILHATRWVAEAWKQVSSDTIKKCFRNAGILTESFQVVQAIRISEDSDPFLDIDESNEDDDETALHEQELNDLTAKLQEEDDACEVSDLASAEDDVPVCAEFADDKWDDEFMSGLGPANKAHLFRYR